jgi:hypothetical protein
LNGDILPFNSDRSNLKHLPIAPFRLQNGLIDADFPAFRGKKGISFFTPASLKLLLTSCHLTFVGRTSF